MLRKILFLFMILLFLSVAVLTESCSLFKPDPAPTSTPTITPAPTVTLTPTLIPFPTITPAPIRYYDENGNPL